MIISRVTWQTNLPRDAMKLKIDLDILDYFIYTDKVMEMHNLFLEETQGSFSEVTKLLLLCSHSDPSLDSRTRTTLGTRFGLKFCFLRKSTPWKVAC